MKPPTLTTLAQIAATLATPTEEPEATASRAMKLLEACDVELMFAEIRHKKALAWGTETTAKEKEERQFFSKCKLDKDPWRYTGATDEAVPLNTFLKACMTNSGTEADRTAKWRAFRRWEVTQADSSRGVPETNAHKLDGVMADIMQNDRQRGVHASLILEWRDRFTAFLERESRATKSERGKKGVIGKRKIAETKNFLGGKAGALKPPQVKKQRP